MPTTDGDPWEHTADLVQKHDDNMCDAWVDEIQYILIFAGLFSAIVTAFAIETQKLLQTDPAVTSILLLAQLTNHLGVNSTPPATLSAFKDTSTSSQPLRINVLIFTSLILSLGTALVGILVLQWIRSYRKTDPLSHQDQLCWKVPSLISFLPIFLQLSLVVFFVGLIDFLHTLNESLAVVIGICIATVLLGVTFTTILPGKPSPLPPYQSPQAWLFYQNTTSGIHGILTRLGQR
ncbi:hypothetical protein BJ165DRAFT_1415735 [Panaeolus papilionaceus]|nr:hypothetical protein BJ165DRAFT_1415735 [Panaeolus papilionaceus]